MEYDEYKEQLLTSLIVLKEQRDTLGTLFYVNPEWKKQVEAQYPEKVKETLDLISKACDILASFN